MRAYCHGNQSRLQPTTLLPTTPPATPLPLSRSLALPVLFCHLLYIRDILLVRRVSRKNCENSPVRFPRSFFVAATRFEGRNSFHEEMIFRIFSRKIRISLFCSKTCLFNLRKKNCIARKIHLFAFDSLVERRNSPPIDRNRNSDFS